MLTAKFNHNLKTYNPSVFQQEKQKYSTVDQWTRFHKGEPPADKVTNDPLFWNTRETKQPSVVKMNPSGTDFLRQRSKHGRCPDYSTQQNYRLLHHHPANKKKNEARNMSNGKKFIPALAFKSCCWLLQSRSLPRRKRKVVSFPDTILLQC